MITMLMMAIDNENKNAGDNRSDGDNGNDCLLVIDVPW